MFFSDLHPKTIALMPLVAEEWAIFQTTLSRMELNWLLGQQFEAKPNQIGLLPDANGNLVKALVGIDTSAGYQWALAHLPRKLPLGDYQLVCAWSDLEKADASIGWGLGCYQYDVYTTKKAAEPARLHVDDMALPRIETMVEAIALTRDLINSPPNAMMPEHLAAHTQQLAQQCGADFYQIVGEDLIYQNYPSIHAVGRASAHEPRLLELRWGSAQHPALTLVGKGVCFDTGGLDLKPSSAMRLMKKDMGGAAHVLGLARMIMRLNLPIQLRVLIPAVENAVGGDAFRAGDVLITRSGKSVEVDNTDAEGRLVLCDALTEAVSKNPDLILDFATLTGAARVALGTEIPVFFSNTPALTQQLQHAAQVSGELIWNLPLHQPYFQQLRSQFADFQNSGGSYGGAITAALFLNEFVPNDCPWAHFDMMAWNIRERAGRPVGGEAMGLFAVLSYIEQQWLTFCSANKT